MTVTCLTVIALGLASAVSTASAEATPDCQGSFNPYDYTREELAECDIPTYPATVTELPGGGQLYSYYEPDGELFSKTSVPPEGFDPTSATEDQLAEYGYPPRPTDPTEEAEWEQAVSIPRSTPEPFMPDVTGFSASLSNSHWSGNITTGGGFTYAEADYTEPSFDNTVCNASAEVTWAGIGGGPNATSGSALFQDGTAHSNKLNIGFSNHQPWWEIAFQNKSSSAHQFANGATASAGDAVTAITDTQSQPGYVSFSVFDYTKGQTWQATVARNGATPNPATAEMIAERPSVSGSFPALSDFGSLFFNSDEVAKSGIEQYLSNFSTEPIFMIGESGKTLGYPGFVQPSIGQFNIGWQHCS